MRIKEGLGEKILKRIMDILEDPVKSKKFKERLKKNKDLRGAVDRVDFASTNLKKTIDSLSQSDPVFADIMDMLNNTK